MFLNVDLDYFMARAAVLLLSLAACVCLIVVTLAQFITGVIAHPRTDVSREWLALGAAHFTSSAQVYARLAQAELAATVDREQALAHAEEHASRAVRLSPWNYEYRLLLASIKESKGDNAAAESILRATLALAPA